MVRGGLPRQQTLRAMVQWSWELLTGAKRAVLAALSVFAGDSACGTHNPRLLARRPPSHSKASGEIV